MLKQVAHLNIVTPDLAASEDFYCRILGMSKTFDFLKHGEVFGFYLDAGNRTYIEVFIDTAAQPNPSMMRHICFEVEDMDATITTIRSRGGVITDKKMGGDKSWQAWMRDPSGIDIEVMQYTPESSQLTGNPCLVDW